MKALSEKVTVLIAEDDDDDYFLTEKAFRNCRFEGAVRRVKDGEELMALLRREGGEAAEGFRAPVLLILDLNMPRKDGREVLAEMKSHPDLRCIPIVVLTTSMSEADVHACYRLGANTFIRKPESFEQFTEVIRSLKSFWLEVAALPCRSSIPLLP